MITQKNLTAKNISSDSEKIYNDKKPEVVAVPNKNSKDNITGD